MRAVLSAIYGRLKSDFPLTCDGILQDACKTRPRQKKQDLLNELDTLVEDGVLVDKDSNGQFRISQAELEYRVEIYNMTP